MGHLGLGDLINYIGAVRYYSLLYDEVVVVCKRPNLQNAKDFFADESGIKFHVVDNDRDISPALGAPRHVFDTVTKSFNTVALCGSHKNPKTFVWDETSECFYRDLNIPVEVRRLFFKVPREDQLDCEIPFRFAHQLSSTKTLKLVTWDINQIFTIDPNTNLYPSDHKWFSLANSYIGHRLLRYQQLLENAEELHLVNSSFACLASYLDLRGNIARSYDRDSGRYITAFTFNRIIKT